MQLLQLIFLYTCFAFMLNASESKQQSQAFRECTDSLSSIEKRRFHAITVEEKSALAALLDQKITQCLELKPSKIALTGNAENK